MALTPILATGLAFQSIFVGGNVAISALFIPIIRNNNIAPSSQVKIWERVFVGGAKLMVSSAVASTLCYLYLAYYSASSSERTSMLVSAGFSLSVILFTRVAMYPNIRYLQGLARLSDEELKSEDYGQAIDHWNKLSILRCLIFSVGFINALWCQVEAY